MTAAAIDARGLGKDFGAIRALDGLDLEIRDGEFFGLLGPNGAGKTTTVRAARRASRDTMSCGRGSPSGAASGSCSRRPRSIAT